MWCDVTSCIVVMRYGGVLCNVAWCSLVCCDVVHSRTCLAWKGFTETKNVGPLVSNQERRTAVVPLINPLSTADRPLVKRGFGSSTALHRISLVRASGEMFKTCVFDALEGTRDSCLLGEPFCRRRVLPGPAPPPRRAPPRPDPPVVCPGFGFDRCTSYVVRSLFLIQFVVI